MFTILVSIVALLGGTLTTASDVGATLARWTLPLPPQPVEGDALEYRRMIFDLQPHAVAVSTWKEADASLTIAEVDGTCHDPRGVFQCRVAPAGNTASQLLPEPNIRRTWAIWSVAEGDGGVESIIARFDDGSARASVAVAVRGAWKLARVGRESVMLRAAASRPDADAQDTTFVVVLNTEDLFPLYEGSAARHPANPGDGTVYAFDDDRATMYVLATRRSSPNDAVSIRRYSLRTGLSLDAPTDISPLAGRVLLRMFDALQPSALAP